MLKQENRAHSVEYNDSSFNVIISFVVKIRQYKSLLNANYYLHLQFVLTVKVKSVVLFNKSLFPWMFIEHHSKLSTKLVSMGIRNERKWNNLHQLLNVSNYKIKIKKSMKSLPRSFSNFTCSLWTKQKMKYVFFVHKATIICDVFQFLCCVSDVDYFVIKKNAKIFSSFCIENMICQFFFSLSCQQCFQTIFLPFFTSFFIFRL